MRIAVLAAVLSFGLTVAAAADASPVSILPQPASVTMNAGSFRFANAGIAASDAGGRAAGERLRSLVARSGGAPLAFSAKGTIRFRRDPSILGPEAYRLIVTPSAVDIRAATDAGLYYGAETLWQLIASKGSAGRIPALTIDDRPAFSWRGVMLDSARHFQPVSYVKELIDRMAIAKLNTLHWHLTDDQGWRIQIDRYPRLTSVGAWRQPAGAAGFDAAGKPVRYGGYYTKADIRAVVAYAAARHVTIVPEIDMPGHATAMVAAYPELASTPSPPAAPSHDWGILPNLLNADEPTFTFVENVLDEVMALFPGKFIHVGGDEAVKDQWKSNPAIQAKIRSLGLKDEDALQAWFTARVAAYLEKHGRRAIGWDEILYGQVPANSAVMSWHGIDGAVAAAKAGHDAVLAASPILYLDHIQSPSGDEPPGRGEIIEWRQLYAFEPAPAALTPGERQHILGLQANLWTEHVRTTEYADRMLWPRAAIVAEIGWSSAQKDWPAFSRRLNMDMARWRKLGFRYDTVPLEPVAPLAPNSRTASQMELCGNSIPLRLEDDGPTAGKRLIHWVDIMHPCWIWRGAALDGVRRLTAQVGRLPFNFSIGEDIKKITFDPPATAAGELHVRRDGCDGPIIATVPLAAATRTSGAAEVAGAIVPQSGAHDLCVTFSQSGPDPFWVLDRLTLQ
ncbi:MAG TPA: family 20 glycosylhydrolase [Sphingomicrobium sp.]|jgi:hexosaminidase|nr:family 20 glycosylhydrolase [Sphingomicrobium sp.]